MPATATPTIRLAEVACHGAVIGGYITQWISRDGQSSLWLGVGPTVLDAEDELAFRQAMSARQGAV